MDRICKMTLMSKFFFILLVSFTAHGKSLLPEIFYAPPEEQTLFCKNSQFKSELFWRKQMSEHINSLVSFQDEAVQNSYVTLSYLELFKHSTDPHSAFMNYVYANASHHLGRLVRYKIWPYQHPLKLEDQALVKGDVLKSLARNAHDQLSSGLMKHSLSLYKELSWSLGAASLCGARYSLDIVHDENLQRAYRSSSAVEFVRSFIRYEQTYLQRTMYQDFFIAGITRSKILDEMRFISFNGEENESFLAWCSRTRCRTSSHHLENRIAFDVDAVMSELNIVSDKRDEMFSRVEEAKVIPTATYFITQ